MSREFFGNHFSKNSLNLGVWIYWLVIIVVLVLTNSVAPIIFLPVPFVLCLNFLPYYLIKKKEVKYPVLQEEAESRFSHILVLGASHIPVSGILGDQPLINGSLKKMLEGVRLHTVPTNSVLVLSGKSFQSCHMSFSAIQEKAALTLGLKMENVFILSEPSHLEEEALFYYRNFSFHDHPVFLVSKALHLERALYIFSLFGYTIIPAPAFFVHKKFHPTPGWFLVPDFKLIFHFGEYLKEVVAFGFLRFQVKLKIKPFPFRNRNAELRKSSFEILNR